ncbi:hypothetical protein M758_4G183700 [Ceratodon purpureus]|nr:hypothetical protein M758_4G183700 [Ceratodon purpureus]
MRQLSLFPNQNGHLSFFTVLSYFIPLICEAQLTRRGYLMWSAPQNNWSKYVSDRARLHYTPAPSNDRLTASPDSKRPPQCQRGDAKKIAETTKRQFVITGGSASADCRRRRWCRWRTSIA